VYREARSKEARYFSTAALRDTRKAASWYRLFWEEAAVFRLKVSRPDEAGALLQRGPVLVGLVAELLGA
jgi:hypothetical protein